MSAEICHCEPVPDVTGVAIRFPDSLRRGIADFPGPLCSLGMTRIIPPTRMLR